MRLRVFWAPEKILKQDCGYSREETPSPPVSEKDTEEKMVGALGEIKDQIIYWQLQFPSKVVNRTHKCLLSVMQISRLPFFKKYF